MITIQQLTKVYRYFGNRKPTIALNQFDLSVQQGECVALIGPNGSGKSTLFKSLTGLIRPTSGSIGLDQHTPDSYDAKRITGYLPEHGQLPLFLTPHELLSYYASLYEDVSNQRVIEILETVKLSPHASQRMKTFSKGMLQRVELAQALLHNPSILLLDEPTNGLDLFGMQLLIDELQYLKQQGKTILFSSHTFEFVQKIADRIVIIQAGRKLSDERMDKNIDHLESYVFEKLAS